MKCPWCEGHEFRNSWHGPAYGAECRACGLLGTVSFTAAGMVFLPDYAATFKAKDELPTCWVGPGPVFAFGVPIPVPDMLPVMFPNPQFGPVKCTIKNDWGDWGDPVIVTPWGT